MPFEFSGAPPALLSAQSAFSTFASSPQTPANTAATSKSFPTSSQQPSTSPFGSGLSFGQAAKPAFGSTPTWPSTSPSPQCATSNKAAGTLASTSSPAVDPIPESGPNDALSRALARATKGRFAAFGRKEIAADDILINMFESTEKGRRDIQNILTGMREVEANQPAVGTFLRSLFDEMVRRQVEDAIEESSGKEGSQAGSSDATEEATEVATVNNSLRSSTSTSTNSDTEKFDIPRDHWRTKGLSKHLADVLLEEGYIWYPEGARVLADYIVDLLYEEAQQDVVAKVVTLLGRQDNDAAVDNVVYWARRKLLKIEGVYLASPGDTDPNEERSDETEDPTSNLSSPEDDAAIAHGPNDPELAASKEDQPFRFLDLPAELRNWVYRDLMVPGHISFDQRHYSLPGEKYKIVRNSTVNTNILRTCRQIHHEAKDILYENTICVTASTVEGMLPVIPQVLLPDRALSRLTSLTLAFITVQGPRSQQGFKKLHWKQFQEMTSLKKLQICNIEREDQIGESNEKKWMLEQIIERVPADCHLAFESSEGFEDEFAQTLIEELDAEKAKRTNRAFVDAYEVDGELLSTLAEEFKSKQGCKSGSTRDFRFPDRGFNLKPLVPGGDVNPSIVLGGSQ